MANSQTYVFKKAHRVDWINVFEAKANKMNPTKLSYQVDWILDRDDPEYAELHGIATKLLKAVAEEHGIKFDPTLVGKAGGPFWPFASADKINADANRRAIAQGKKPFTNEHTAGKIILKTKSYVPSRPVLSTFSNGKWVDHEEFTGLASKFFRGMEAYGTVAISGFYAAANSWGVSAYVNGVGAAGGAKIGGPMSRSSEYGSPAVEGTTTDFNPTGEDAAIPY